MKHLNEAHIALKPLKFSFTQSGTESEYIKIAGANITFQIQNGPIGEKAVNGMQVTDMLMFVKELYTSLNHAFPCRENSLTITKIEEAIHWQNARTADRQGRGVEGYNKS